MSLNRIQQGMLIFGFMQSVSGAASILPSGTWQSIPFPRLPGLISGLDTGDLNGDGRIDILVSCTLSENAGQRPRRVLIPALQNSRGGYDLQKPLPVPESALVFDLCQPEPQAVPQILFLRTMGLTAHRWNNSRLEDLPVWGVHFKSAMPTPDLNRLPHQPLQCPGYRQLYWGPSATGLELIDSRGPAPVIFSRLKSTPLTQISPDGTLSIQLPRLVQGAMKTAGARDWFVLNGTSVDCYLRQTLRAPEGRPPTYRYHMGLNPLQPSVLEPLKPAEVHIQLADLNGDGLTDLLISKSPGARFTTDVSQIRIYFNHSGCFHDEPDQILTAEHFTGEVQITDINGDSLPDLMLTHFSTGLGQAVRYLFTKRVRIACAVHFMQTAGQYSPAPDMTFSFTRSLALAKLLTGAQPRYYVADFNGDRHLDLLAPVGKENWSLFWGADRKGLRFVPGCHLNAAAEAQLQFADLDGDANPDLILYHDKNENESEIQIFCSRRMPQ